MDENKAKIVILKMIVTSTISYDAFFTFGIIDRKNKKINC